MDTLADIVMPSDTHLRRILIVSLTLAVALFAASMALAQGAKGAGGKGGGPGGPRPPGAGKPPPPADDPNEPRINVTWSTGQTQPAFFIKADPDGVTLRTAKGKEPETHPWAKIKRLSNGVTYEKVLTEWKAQHANELCDTCHGDRVAPCGECKGTGVKADEQKPCEKCSGTGSTGDCKRCKKTGEVDCTDNCLKANQGNWVVRDGKKVRLFPGGAWISDAHIGELIAVENGQPIPKGKCPTCGGTTKIKCPGCKGTLKAICTACKGHAVVGPKCPSCDDGMAKCATCEGTGLKAPSTQPTDGTGAGAASGAGAVEGPMAPPPPAPPPPSAPPAGEPPPAP